MCYTDAHKHCPNEISQILLKIFEESPVDHINIYVNDFLKASVYFFKNLQNHGARLENAFKRLIYDVPLVSPFLPDDPHYCPYDEPVNIKIKLCAYILFGEPFRDEYDSVLREDLPKISKPTLYRYLKIDWFSYELQLTFYTTDIIISIIYKNNI